MRFQYQIYKFVIRPEDIIVLPEYKGSTLRGGFGVAFRRVVCALKKNDCVDCILNTKCIYSYVFESFSFEKTSKIFGDTFSRDIPRPFVIEPPLENKSIYNNKDEIEFNLILFGKAIEYLPYFIYAFELLGEEIGIGAKRGKFFVERVECNGEIVYKDKKIQPVDFDEFVFEEEIEHSDKNMQIRLDFLTPLRLMVDRRIARDIRFEELFKAIHRRIVLISVYHCNSGLPTYDLKSLIGLSKKIEIIDKNLSWYDWERYSNRKGTRMRLGGYIGEISLCGCLTPFMKFIRAGEILHIGKGAVFGMGKYMLYKK